MSVAQLITNVESIVLSLLIVHYMGKEIFGHAHHLLVCKLAKIWLFASISNIKTFLQYWGTPAHKKVVSFQFAEVASIIKI